jgi:hypothetical protein
MTFAKRRQAPAPRLRWTVQIGPHSVSMTVSWIGLVVAALLAIWGFSLSA